MKNKNQSKRKIKLNKKGKERKGTKNKRNGSEDAKKRVEKNTAGKDIFIFSIFLVFFLPGEWEQRPDREKTINKNK